MTAHRDPARTTVVVEIYRAPGYGRFGQIPLAPLLREVFEPLLHRDLSSARFLLFLSAVSDADRVDGQPSMVNLRSGHGYGTVTIIDAAGRVIYQHPHSVSEIVAVPLQKHLARQFPTVGHWGFGLIGPGLEDLAMVRPTPSVAGEVSIQALRRRRSTAHVEEVADPDAPLASLEGLGVADPTMPYAGPMPAVDAPPVSVVLRRPAHVALVDHDFSREVEEGGFLIGHRHRDSTSPDHHLLEITAVIGAESTGASLLRFTFTGESFLQLGNLLARRGNGEEILGWYHTHLFAATAEFGLSTVDVRLHLTTFRRPWQVAALVNIEDSRRVLRFYGVVPGGEMAEVPMWLVDDRRGDRGTAVRHAAADPPATLTVGPET